MASRFACDSVVELDVRQHVERDGQDARARPQDVAVARPHLDAVG